jgi:hypothetical protein
MMVNNFIKKNINMRALSRILILINMQIKKFIYNLKKLFFISISSSKTFECLTFSGIEGLYFTSTSYLSFWGKGTLKLLAEASNESAIEFYSLGTNEILKSKKKL